MKFDTPATANPIDQLKVIGKPTDRIDGPLKTSGTARYAHDRYDVVANQAYGYVLGAGIAKGRITSIDMSAAKDAPGVLAIDTLDGLADDLELVDRVCGGWCVESHLLIPSLRQEQRRACARRA